MDLETAQTNATAKFPILKQGPVTTKEKAQKKNDVKARSMLLMALPNEHQLTFNQYKDAKTLFDAIQTRFGGNDATRKTQKTILKQMNKSDLDTLSIDDLYNNFKIIKQEVKRTVTSSSNSNSSSQNMAIVSSPNSTNEVNTANFQVSTANSPISTTDTPASTANLNDLEEIDLKWQLTLLSMRARRYFQRTGKKITINGSDTARYDKSKVECFNCHKMRHFARECRGLKNQDDMNKNQDSSRRTVNVEETSSKAMVAIDGDGFDWSFMADEEVPTNIALMAFSDSEIEKLKKEKESNQIKIDKFENASKSLDKLIGSQISDKSRKGVGFVSYNAVPPPPTGLFAPSTIDLSNSGLEEFQQPEFEGYGPKASKSVCKYTSNEVKKTPDAPLVNTAKEKVYTAKPKAVNTNRPTSAIVNAVRANQVTCPISQTSRNLIEDMLPLGEEPDEEELLLPDESQVLLKVPRKNNMYSVDMKNIVPKESLTCLVANAILDESMLWHRRLGHIKFKTINKLVKDNLLELLRQKWCLLERRKGTLIEAVRTMLADSKLPTTYWAEAVNTACYVQNRVIIVKPHNKTPYELFKGKTHALSFMRPFGCHVTILNTLDHLGKFNGKSNDGFFVGYLLTSKAFRVYNIITRKVKEKLHIRFLENKPIITGDGPKWLFDIDSLTKSMNYVPIVAGTNSNDFTGSEESNGAGHSSKEIEFSQDYIVMPLWKDGIIPKNLLDRVSQTTRCHKFDLLKDAEAEYVDVHLYRLMIGSLMYLTASRPDIMFVVCACARFQVTPKVSHLHAVKRIFRYLKGQPKLGLWYPKDSPFDLEAYTDSDYASASLDRKSTTGGCQFLRSRLISWQCKKQTIVANSTTEAEYVAAAIKNPVFHSKTKHIEIRHHFMRDSNEKKLIQMIKIHIDQNVADLLTKAFDVGRFQYLIATEYAQMMLETVADDAIQVSTVGPTYYCHIRYALTENPTIYVSLIQQFWQTATASTLDNGEMEITAIIDGKVKTVSEASIRRHLKLEDSDGIGNLPTTEIFEQLALMGNMRRASKGYTGVDIPLFPTMLVQGPVESVVPQPRSPTQTNVADEAASTGMDVRHGGAATTVTSLDAGQGSVNIDKTPSMPHDSPLPRVHTLGSDEGRMQHNELMDLVTKLSDKVVGLETDLQQTKKVYGTTFTKIIKNVKKLEKTVKTRQARRKVRIVVSNDEEDLEDPSKQGRKIAKIDQDPNISLVQHDAEPVSTAGASVSTTGASSAKDKGKAIMEEVETIQTKTKLQLEQERLGYEEALRLQAKIDEEERQRIARRLQLKEREMYSKAEKTRLLAELINERKRYFVAQRAEERRNKPLTQAQQRTYMSQYIKNIGTAGSSKRDAEEELVQERLKRLKTGESSVPAEEPKDKEEEELSQERIQQMMIIVPEQGMNVEALQTKYPIIDWEIYTEGARKVHYASTKDGIDIYMLVEKEYPLSRGTLTLMMVAKLLVEQDSEMSRVLLRKIFMQVSCKGLLSVKSPVTTKEKVQKNNDMKARSMLLMALPNEHLMTFNQYKDVKTLFAAIQTQILVGKKPSIRLKRLLMKQIRDFSAPSTESLDSFFNRLQKIVSQLSILGENISQEDLNLKFLRSLPSKWNTHVVVWGNKPDLDTMSFDDLYNNFKIVEQEVKGTASSSSNSQNMAFVSSPNSTNEINTTYGVSTANTQVNSVSTQVSTASTQVSTANLSDDTVYAFLASQPNGS
ncbi:ribonuclease H-like domain-containing protein [Tanacetum coccineum]